ncbi:DNA ligase D [Caldimonas sp. KR1-144]|uniref:DNA ligase D n=1 Tax=Caldimonas sp. KR1-144 TaxID=3400911 RepID=UPI003C0246D8
MADPLQRYRAKRDFRITREPEGGRAAARGAGSLAFVVQEHHARRLHWDFRLELDGTLKSWAVPRGISDDPADRRLAVQVEDHPLSYGSFEGRIPAGQYGAGTVEIWDRGEWQPEGDPRRGLARGKLHFELRGRRLRGHWTLVRTRDPSQWLLFKSKASADAPAPAHEARAAPAPDAPGRALKNAPRAELPDTLAPQLATLVKSPPADESNWLYEAKFDGYRILTRIERKQVRMFSRNGLDWTERFAALARSLAALRLPDGWYDGEVVMPGKQGLPDFAGLQAALANGARGADALHYYLFDLPFCEGKDLRGVPLELRRAKLRELLGEEGGVVHFSSAFEQTGRDLHAAACKLGLEGLIAKRRDAPYASGRNTDWLKLKCRLSQEFVVGGYTHPKGSRADLGALLLGVQAAPGKAGPLRYVGNVGSGFSASQLAMLRKRLEPLQRESSPFADGPKPVRTIAWVEPRLVIEADFASWTADGHLRQASFRGLREDKPARQITIETARELGDAPAAKKPAAKASAKSAAANATASQAGGYKLTHPERVVDAHSGATKAEVAEYYARVAEWIAPHLAQRPAAVLRAPSGIGAKMFFQKHKPAQMGLDGVDEVAIEGDDDSMLGIAVPQGLMACVQWNVLEFHTVGAWSRSPGVVERLSFDLDPGEGVQWPRVVEAAKLLRTMLLELGLEPFVKTSGGKGLHVVVPLAGRCGWERGKAFCKAVAEHLARTLPERFVAIAGPRRRVGRVFVDYLRNQPGATTACAWSVRARPGLPVSLPIEWEELDAAAPLRLTLREAIDARPQGNAPWAGYEDARRTLRDAERALLRAGRTGARDG